MRFVIFILCMLAGTAWAAPQAYRLDSGQSQVGFSYVFEGTSQQGVMPVAAADITLDLDNLPNSRVDVTLNARAARAGFIFATDAMKSPEVLNTAAHPTIRFRSSSVSGNLNGARVKGQLTVRGVTRPVTLKAELYRQAGTDAGELSKLTILLTGQIDRRDFGAVGFPNYVGPMIGLRILARIER